MCNHNHETVYKYTRVMIVYAAYFTDSRVLIMKLCAKIYLHF